jgi:glycosyltransferase involved in cell wall biosynthesis
MRIAVFHNLPSGGAKRAMAEMIRQLTAAGDTIDVFAPSTADETFFPSSQVASSVTIVDAPTSTASNRRLRLPRFGQGLRDAAAVQRSIADMIDAAGYDVAFVHHCRFVQSPWVLAYLQTPSVYFCQEPYRIVYEARLRPDSRVTRARLWMPSIGIARIDRANIARADRILANSDFSRESILRAYGIDSSAVPLGVDASVFSPGRPDEKDGYVLAVGAISRFKGHRLVIEAVAKIPESRRPPILIIGDRTAGGEVELLRAMAARGGVAMEIRTLVSDDELVAAYRGASMVACAAELEPFGLTALEAAAAGVPVVAVREGGYRETVLDGVTGLLVPDRRPESMASAFEELAGDAGLRARLGAAAVERARGEWSWERTGAMARQHLAAAARSA